MRQLAEKDVGKETARQPVDKSFLDWRTVIKYLGPAFIVSVAYIDPGNFATNIMGGSKFNYNLVWVILWSNLMAIFCQTLSAKLGIATGRNLPEMCAVIFSKRVNWVLWVMAEFAAIATYLAEFLGGTLGLYLLFHIPMVYAGLLTGLTTFTIIFMEKYGQRVVEWIIGIFVGIISVAYIIELFLSKPNWNQAVVHTLIPSLPNGEAVLIAVGMLGATVMPHVIYLHSQLVQCRNGDHMEWQKRRHLKLEKIDIVIAMNVAFIVNAAMVVVSAAVFHSRGMAVESIEQAHRSLEPLVGSLSSGAFGIALLASGFSSSAVGAMAGQTIMKGFVNLELPINLRRFITMTPAIVIIALGVNPMKALIISQVVLSFTLPLAIIPLLLITNRRDLMGSFANRHWTKLAGWIIATAVIGLNMLLLFLTLLGKV